MNVNEKYGLLLVDCYCPTGYWDSYAQKGVLSPILSSNIVLLSFLSSQGESREI